MRHRNLDGKYNEKRVSDGTTNSYYPGRSDSERRLNPNAPNPDVQLNSSAVPPPATGYDTGVSGYR